MFRRPLTQAPEDSAENNLRYPFGLTRIFHETTENTKNTKKIKVLSFYSRNFMNSYGNMGKHLNSKSFVIFVVKYSGQLPEFTTRPWRTTLMLGAADGIGLHILHAAVKERRLHACLETRRIFNAETDAQPHKR